MGMFIGFSFSDLANFLLRCLQFGIDAIRAQFGKQFRRESPTAVKIMPSQTTEERLRAEFKLGLEQMESKMWAKVNLMLRSQPS